MAKIARLVADPHADKDAEIDHAEHVAAIAEFNEKAALARVAQLEAALEFEHEETKRLREIIMPLRARVAELEAAWTDDKGTTWRPPTAWAYAQSCRVREELRARVAKLEAALTKISTAARKDTSLVPEDPLLTFIVGVVDAALSETVEA